MPSRVVAQINGGIPQRGRQHLAMIDGLPLMRHIPLQFVHAQAVDQQQDPPGGLGQGCRARPIEDFPLVAQGHRNRKRAVAGRQAVAHDPVEHCEDGFALRRPRGCLFGGGENVLQAIQGQIEAFAHQVVGRVDGLVNQAGDSARLPLRLAAAHPHEIPDRLVHALDDPCHRIDRQRCQLNRSPQIRHLQMPWRLIHHSLPSCFRPGTGIRPLA